MGRLLGLPCPSDPTCPPGAPGPSPGRPLPTLGLHGPQLQLGRRVGQLLPGQEQLVLLRLRSPLQLVHLEGRVHGGGLATRAAWPRRQAPSLFLTLEPLYLVPKQQVLLVGSG